MYSYVNDLIAFVITLNYTALQNSTVATSINTSFSFGGGYVAIRP